MPHEDYCYALERENKTLIEKYADIQKREVMLRNALKVVVDKPKSHEAVRVATQALAATADLDCLILCHAEPVLYYFPPTGKTLHSSRCEESRKVTWKPLYRAWEPK